MAKDSDAWEELATKVIGSPVNVKFNDFFNIEKLTVLGEVSDSLREKIEPMNPVFRPYLAGFSIQWASRQTRIRREEQRLCMLLVYSASFDVTSFRGKTYE